MTQLKGFLTLNNTQRLGRVTDSFTNYFDHVPLQTPEPKDPKTRSPTTFRNTYTNPF